MYAVKLLCFCYICYSWMTFGGKSIIFFEPDFELSYANGNRMRVMPVEVINLLCEQANAITAILNFYKTYLT